MPHTPDNDPSQNEILGNKVSNGTVNTVSKVIAFVSVVLFFGLVADIYFNEGDIFENLAGMVHDCKKSKEHKEQDTPKKYIAYQDRLARYAVPIIDDYKTWENLTDYNLRKGDLEELRFDCVDRYTGLNKFAPDDFKNHDYSLWLAMLKANNAIVCADLNRGDLYISSAPQYAREALRILENDTQHLSEGFLQEGVTNSIFGMRVYADTISYINAPDENKKKAIIDFVNKYYESKQEILGENFINERIRPTLVDFGLILVSE